MYHLLKNLKSFNVLNERFDRKIEITPIKPFPYSYDEYVEKVTQKDGKVSLSMYVSLMSRSGEKVHKSFPITEDVYDFFVKNACEPEFGTKCLEVSNENYTIRSYYPRDEDNWTSPLMRVVQTDNLDKLPKSICNNILSSSDEDFYTRPADDDCLFDTYQDILEDRKSKSKMTY